MNRKEVSFLFGYFAEIIVIFFLFFVGCRVIHHRYRNCYGEIDIIALRKDSIFFIEVKARKSIKACSDVLSFRQIKRIKRAAEYFLAISLTQYKMKYENYRSFFVLYHISFFSIMKSYF